MSEESLMDPDGNTKRWAAVVDEVIREYQSADIASLILGSVMRRLKGQANPGAILQLINARLYGAPHQQHDDDDEKQRAETTRPITKMVQAEGGKESDGTEEKQDQQDNEDGSHGSRT